MPKWRNIREHLLYSHYEGIIDDEDFLLLYDLHTAKSPDLPYWNYHKFDLDRLSDDECITEFRFLKNYIYRLIGLMLGDVGWCWMMLGQHVGFVCTGLNSSHGRQGSRYEAKWGDSTQIILLNKQREESAQSITDSTSVIVKTTDTCFALLQLTGGLKNLSKLCSP